MTKAIILMAGQSSRFAAEGFTKPKTLLSMPDGRTLLEWQVDALEVNHYLLVGQQGHHKAHKGVLKRLYFKHAGLRDTWLKKPTKGPMATLFAKREHFMHDGEDYIVAYCDNLPTPQWSNDFLFTAQRYNKKFGTKAIVAAIDSDDERLTILPRRSSPPVLPLLDRMRCGGIFWFESGRLLAEMIRRHPREANNGVPDAVYRTRNWAPFLRPDLADLGVPREYKNWMAEQGKPVHEW